MKSEPPPVYLVTGAFGGLGRPVAEELARAGARVLAGWHSGPPEAAPEGLEPVPLDVTNETQCRAAVELAVARHGRLDGVVHCAGTAHNALLARLDAADWDACFRVNLDGTRRLDRAAIRPMVRQRSGHLVHIGSFAGIAGAEGRSAYAASKAALHGLTQSLAQELGSRNIQVNTVLPGVLRTPMTESLGEDRLAGFASGNTLGRLNDPAEVARFISFLLTTRNVSGQLFNLDSRIHRWA
jgi:3-oxoacyl-[acyl-carrier protein] reductase